MREQQIDLFGEKGLKPKRQQVVEQKTEQERELRRVTTDLRAHVIVFAKKRWASKGEAPAFFYGADLEAAVMKHTSATPGSATRILRVLRQEGHLNYRVVNRSQALYELTEVPA